MTGVICFLTPPTPPRQRFVKFFSISPCFYLRINTFSVVCVYPGRVVGYLNMKLVYICRAGFKNGGLRERPLTENEGLSERPLTGKTGDFGVKDNKETYIFLNEGLFDLPSRSEKRYKELYIFEKGVFWSSPGRKSERL